MLEQTPAHTFATQEERLGHIQREANALALATKTFAVSLLSFFDSTKHDGVNIDISQRVCVFFYERARGNAPTYQTQNKHLTPIFILLYAVSNLKCNRFP